MTSIPGIRGVIFFCLFFVNTTAIPPEHPAEIKGRIIQSKSGNSVENAYLYIVPGEEEALTDKDGQFDIGTSQPFPVTLVVEHPYYKQKRIIIRSQQEKPLISLDKK